MGKRDFEALEMGYVFNRNYWGCGYAAESCKALIEQAFYNGIHRIYAECDPNNKSSWKLLETLGFQREAHFRKNVYFWKDEAERPIWKDTYVYAKLKRSILSELAKLLKISVTDDYKGMGFQQITQ